MTLHDVNTAQEATADFALLLAEAARVLAEMAAEPDARAEDLDTLHEIHVEGGEFAATPGIPVALRGLFDSILTLGSKVAATSGPLPEASLAQIHVVESIARSVAAALDEVGNDQQHVTAIVRNVAALTAASPTATDLRGAANAASVAVEQFVADWSR